MNERPSTGKFRIRLVGTHKPQWEHPDVDFDPAIPLDSCDGLLVWGPPTPEFLAYRGPRAWYTDEARTHGMFRTRLFREALEALPKSEFLHHSNPDPAYRFPCITHYGELTRAAPEVRRDAIIAVVSNYGGRAWWMRRGSRFRNPYILASSVELFGKPESWETFRRWPWSRAGKPHNYKGAFDSNWNFPGHMEALGRYRANVCFENACMPYYFTEKFVNAARAGCVPIYHPHATVRSSFLEGARWIDPADFGFDVSRTLTAALECDARTIRENNWQWLCSERLKATNGYEVWRSVADLFVDRIRSGGRVSR